MPGVLTKITFDDCRIDAGARASGILIRITNHEPTNQPVADDLPSGIGRKILVVPIIAFLLPQLIYGFGVIMSLIGVDIEPLPDVWYYSTFVALAVCVLFLVAVATLLLAGETSLKEPATIAAVILALASAAVYGLFAYASTIVR